jgi:hypothetical protein
MKMLGDQLFSLQEDARPSAVYSLQKVARREHAPGPPGLSAVRKDLGADCGEIQPSAG